MGGAGELRYVCTAQKATAVSSCCVVRVRREGSSSEARHLVVSKGTRLEVYSVSTRSGEIRTEFRLESDVCGRVVAMESFRPTGSEKDLVWILTEDRAWCTLGLVTERQGRIATGWTRLGKGCFFGADKNSIQPIVTHKYLSAIEERLAVGAALVHDGFLDFFQLMKTTDQESRPSQEKFCRLREVRVIDMTWVQYEASGYGLLAVLHDDGPRQSRRRHVATYRLQASSLGLEARPGPYEVIDLDAGTSRLLSHPSAECVLTVGAREIACFDRRTGSGLKRLATSCGAPELPAACWAGDGRWLLGDDKGRLLCAWLVNKRQANGTVSRKPKLQSLGDLQPADITCLARLGERNFFAGSRTGDALMASLGADGIQERTLVAANLGPIVDLCFLDGAQNTLVTCCASTEESEGALRFLRQGIELVATEKKSNEFMTLPSDAMLRGLWAVTTNKALSTHTLVATCIRSGLAATISSSAQLLESEESTLLAANANTQNAVIQVTTSSVKLFEFSTGDSTSPDVSEWSAVEPLLLAASTEDLVIVASGSRVNALSWQEQWQELSSCDLEASCLACSKSIRRVALAHWDAISEISLRRADALNNVETTAVMTEAVRSLAFLEEDVLAVGLGDGYLCVLDVPNLNIIRRLSLGTKPVRIFPWRDISVFAVSERSAVLSYDQRLEVTAAHLESGDWTDAKCTALDDNRLAVWRPDGKGVQVFQSEQSRQMRARSIRLNGQPRAVCLNKNVLFVAMAADRSQPTQGGSIRFLSDRAPHKQYSPSLQLENYEEPLVCRCLELRVDKCRENEDRGTKNKKQRLDPTGYGIVSDQGASFVAALRSGQSQAIATTSSGEGCFVVVGTAIPGADDFEPGAGRVLLLEDTQVKWSREVAGAVYDVCTIDKERIACCVNHAVLIFDAKLETQLGAYEGFVTALRLHAPTESRLVVGDLMRSVSVLEISNAATSSANENFGILNVDEVARDLNANWTAALYADKNEILLSEAGHNLLSLGKRSTRRTPTEKEDHHMDTRAAMHLGDFASCFCRGSLTATELCEDSGTAQILFGCVSGRIGCILPVTPDQLIRLDRLQRAMVTEAHFIGDLDYFEFRAFKTDSKHDDFHGFLDGDLLESFLNFSTSKQHAIVDALNNEMDDGKIPGSIEALSVNALKAEITTLRQMH